MTGFGAAASAAAAERCALAIRARPAASSPAKRQQQSASLRRSGGGQRRPTTLAASRRGPVVPRAVATSADRASPDVSTSCLLYVSPLGHHQLMRYHCLAICLLHFPFFPLLLSQLVGKFTLDSNSELQVRPQDSRFIHHLLRILSL